MDQGAFRCQPVVNMAWTTESAMRGRRVDYHRKPEAGQEPMPRGTNPKYVAVSRNTNPPFLRSFCAQAASGKPREYVNFTILDGKDVEGSKLAAVAVWAPEQTDWFSGML